MCLTKICTYRQSDYWDHAQLLTRVTIQRHVSHLTPLWGKHWFNPCHSVFVIRVLTILYLLPECYQILAKVFFMLVNLVKVGVAWPAMNIITLFCIQLFSHLYT